MWLAYQLNRPDHKNGIILAFRRGDCGNDSIRVNPRDLDQKATCELFYEDYDLRIKNTRKELMDGFYVAIPQKPASLLISYHELKGEK